MHLCTCCFAGPASSSCKGPHLRQRLTTATAMCSQIAVAVAVDGLHTHAATDLFNFSVESQFSDSNNVGPHLWWPNRPQNIRKFWSTATTTATCKLRWWLRLLEPIHGKFGQGCRWKLRLRLKIAVVDGALKWWCRVRVCHSSAVYRYILNSNTIYGSVAT